jgi:FkbM family methyltransferase
MMSLIYKIVYHPLINFLLRNLVKPLVKLFAAKMPFSISGTLRINYQNTTFILKTNQTCAVTQNLFFYGADSYEFTPLFAHCIRQCKVFFDIGANIGYFTVLGKKLNPDISVYAFEPSHGPHCYLKMNVHKNNLENVQVIEKAVSNITGSTTFFDVINPKYPWVKYQLNGSSSLQNQFGAIKKARYPVDTITLQEFVNTHKPEYIDLIKLDTECTEHHILETGIPIIQKFKPVIISEVYDVIEKDIERIIHSLQGYELFHYKNKELHSFQSFSEIQDNLNRNFVFCHRDQLKIIQPFIKTGNSQKMVNS